MIGVSPPSGLLLHGPSGCGKTTLALAIAGELQLPFHKVIIIMVFLHFFVVSSVRHDLFVHFNNSRDVIICNMHVC